MKLKLLLLLASAVFCTATYSQSVPEKFNFFGELKNGVVRLYFMPETWPDNLIGFHIKKKEGEGWTTLNNSAIIPEIKLNSELPNIVNDELYKTYINEKATEKIRNQSLKEIKNESFLALLKNDQSINGIRLMLLRDFDLLIIAGLGFHNPVQADSLILGLFPEYISGISEKPIKELSLNENSGIPDLKITTNYQRQGKNLEISWKLSEQIYDSIKILNGFNIYKETDEDTIKLNKTPIWMHRNEGIGTISYRDKAVTDTIKISYSLKPVTIFNTESTGYRIVISANPQGINLQPSLRLNSTDNDNSTVVLSWDKLLADSIKIEQRKSIDGGWVLHKTLKKGDTVLMINNNFDPNISYYYRLQSITREQIKYSNYAEYSYSEKSQNDKKISLEGEFISTEKAIILKWTNAYKLDTLFLGYQLFTNTPPDTILKYESGIGLLSEDSHNYSIDYYFSREYIFTLRPTFKDGTNGICSDTLKVEVPNLFFPTPSIQGVVNSDSNLSVKWKFPFKLTNFQGFNLYINGEVTNNSPLPINNRIAKIDIKTLAEGIYSVQMAVVSDSQEGNLSKPYLFKKQN